MRTVAKSTSQKAASREITVGELSSQSGLAVSAIHFYEAKGLITGRRTTGNRRRYPADTAKRVAVIKAAHRAGIPLKSVHQILIGLPPGSVHTARAWGAALDALRRELAAKMFHLSRIQKELESCVGCGCLSFDSCPLLTAAADASGDVSGD